MMRMTGRVALVTGASRGFGRATAILLAHEGADVVVNYRRAAHEADPVAEQVRSQGRRALSMRADVADPEQARSLASQALEAFGRVDVLVNNAGIMDVRPFVEQDLTTWRATIGTNLFGLLTLTHAMLPSMIERQHGRIVSLASQLAHVRGENFAVYAGTKAFVLAFTRSLAREFLAADSGRFITGQCVDVNGGATMA